MDYLGPALAAFLFIAIVGLVPEPQRRTLNAVLVAGASSTYLSGGGFGVWELPYLVLGGTVGTFALGSYRIIALGWLLHTGWDLLHHFYGNPIWPFMPSSSMGCAIFDPILAAWCLAGAPAILSRPRRARAAASR